MSVLTLSEAMTHLNITSDENADELQDVIDAAEALLAQRVGPIGATTTTSIVVSAGTYMVLPVSPVISLTSVTSLYDASTVDVGDLTVDPDSGIVVSNVYGTTFNATGGVYTVVYEAGRTVVPADLLMAAKEMVRHLWKTQRGGSMRPGSTDSTPPAGYLIPNAVAELIEPYRQLSVA